MSFVPPVLMTYLVIPAVKIVVILGFLIMLAAYMTFFERKLLAYMQQRVGPNRVFPRGWLQPIADALKLFVKEDVTPAQAQKFVFLLGPCLIIAPALVIFSVIPFGPTDLFRLTDVNIGLLFILGVSSVGIYGIILGGWASNNKFSLMGGLRSAAQLISYEIPMGLSVVAVLLLANSLSLVKIVEAQREAGWWFGFWYGVPGLLAFFIYVVCGVAETNRSPFDLPEAESELVAGFHTEYSGMSFAFYFLAEYANMAVISCMATILFLGGWLRPFPGVAALSFLDVVPPVVWFLAKMAAFLFAYIWFRATFPRYRFDQLMALGWKVLIPASLANLVLVSGLVLLVGGSR